MFITFEGIDGCGKSTQSRSLYGYLYEKGHPIHLTREPGGCKISEEIREILINQNYDYMCNECELFLFLAARAQHVQEVIKPALDEGYIVICDRFQDATFAYQGFGRGISIPTLNTLNSIVSGIEPDITFILDIPVELSIERIKNSGKDIDRIEAEEIEFFKKLRKGYLWLAKNFTERIYFIDGIQEIDIISKQIFNIVDSKLS